MLYFPVYPLHLAICFRASTKSKKKGSSLILTKSFKRTREFTIRVASDPTWFPEV